MGIQFRLGPGDHKPVEDFLSREHVGTTAITLDTKAARHQHDAAAAAVDAGLAVYWEPAAERLATPGFGLEVPPVERAALRHGCPVARRGGSRRTDRQDSRQASVDRHARHRPTLLRHQRAHRTPQHRSRRAHPVGRRG